MKPFYIHFTDERMRLAEMKELQKAIHGVSGGFSISTQVL